MNLKASHSRLQPQWLYVFAAAMVVSAIAVVVLAVLALTGLLHAGGDAMAGM